jgi:hypothetical protein
MMMPNRRAVRMFRRFALMVSSMECALRVLWSVIELDVAPERVEKVADRR